MKKVRTVSIDPERRPKGRRRAKIRSSPIYAGHSIKSLQNISNALTPAVSDRVGQPVSRLACTLHQNDLRSPSFRQSEWMSKNDGFLRLELLESAHRRADRAGTPEKPLLKGLFRIAKGGRTRNLTISGAPGSSRRPMNPPSPVGVDRPGRSSHPPRHLQAPDDHHGLR